MFIQFLKLVRKTLTFWVAPQTYQHLENIRIHEAGIVLALITASKSKSIVEIGGGAGWQKRYFEERGILLKSFDIETSGYSHLQQGDVIIYDGITLPLKDDSCDLLFSSNTLEHIANLPDVLSDHHRILNNSGLCIHLMPTASWRIWTSISDVIKKFYFDKPHGELSSNIVKETFDFSERRWRERFEESGFFVQKVIKNRLFYTGNSIFDSRLSIKFRIFLSYVMGSACKIYIVKLRANKYRN